MSRSRLVQFGGPAFLLATCRINLLLAAAPAWMAAVYLPLSLVGIAGYRGEFSARVGCAVGLYLTAFSVVGGLFNAYWGLLFAPLLPFGFARSVDCLGDLWWVGFGREGGHTPTPPDPNSTEQGCAAVAARDRGRGRDGRRSAPADPRSACE